MAQGTYLVSFLFSSKKMYTNTLLYCRDIHSEGVVDTVMEDNLTTAEVFMGEFSNATLTRKPNSIHEL